MGKSRLRQVAAQERGLHVQNAIEQVANLLPAFRRHGRDVFLTGITGAKCYVCETGKSMKAVELALSQKGCWRNIPITLIDGS